MTISDNTVSRWTFGPATARRAGGFRTMLIFSIAFAGAIGLAVLLSMYFRGQPIAQRAVTAAGLFVIAAFIGGVATWFGPHRFLCRLSPTRRFAANAVVLSTVTIGFAALFHFLHVVAYFGTWHGEIFSILWLYQIFWTAVSSTYAFAVFGVRLLLPFGVAVMALAAFTLAAMRPTS